MTSKQSIKILLVDDDPSILEILYELVTIFGYGCETAKNGMEALDKLKQDVYHIVLTDMIMPGMSGMDLLIHISSHYPQIKVMVLTGYDRSFTYTDVIQAGASDFISKPFNSDELEAKISRLVREIELMHQLELLSISDGLTGLYNRRHFDIKIIEEARRADRQNHDLFLAVIDVDNLKEMNDRHGHLEGDKVLKLVGRIIKHGIRENVDWPFRYGGDEFCVIITQVSQDQALMTAERILQSYNEKKPPLTGLSIGLARFIRSNDKDWAADIDDLVKRADIALYKAKQTGRNRIVIDRENDKTRDE
ncbi:MAG: diguanylate cyclase [Deltaproteobacteria bacterium]|jgi:two-component system cell cycle response regulator|nr:diguanylate cyclase [Deltaproteobacteria bacterium]